MEPARILLLTLWANLKKQFSCEITGHMNLSFFEALISEVRISLIDILRPGPVNINLDTDREFARC